MQLKDFIPETQEPVTLEELTPEKESYKVISEPSNNHVAAQAAMLSPGDVQRTHNLVKSELDNTGKSFTLETMTKRVRDESDVSSKNALWDILGDQEVSPEDKEATALAYAEGFHERFSETHIADTISDTAAEDSFEGATPEMVDLTVDLSAHVSRVNKHKQEMQKMLNAAYLTRDEDTLGKTVTFLESMVPLVTGFKTAKVQRDVGKATGINTDPIQGFLARGNALAEMRDSFESMPLEERMDAAKKLLDVVNSHTNIGLVNGSAYTSVDEIRAALEVGYYTDADKFFDNVFSVIDSVGITSLLTRPFKGLRGSPKLSGDGIATGPVTPTPSVNNRISPVSVSETVKDVNPDKYKEMYELASQNDEVAKAAFGAESKDVVAEVNLPEVAKVTGIKDKVHNAVDKELSTLLTNKKIQEFAEQDGYLYLNPEEHAALIARQTNKFSEATGVIYRDEMSITKDLDGGKTSITRVFGPNQMGWSNGEEALDLTELAVRYEGLERKDLTLLVKDDVGEYVPYKGDTSAPGNYLVSTEEIYSPKPIDMQGFYDPLDVGWTKFMYRLPSLSSGRAGTLTNYIFDPAAIVDPKISSSANVAGEKFVGLEHLLTVDAQEYTKQLHKLDKNSQRIISDTIRDSNSRGISVLSNKRFAVDFTEQEVEALTKWKSVNDTLYTLNNTHAVKTAQARGALVYRDKNLDTTLLVDPVPFKQAQAVKEVYNPTTNQVDILDDVDELYEGRGSLVRLERPMVLDDGKTVDYMRLTDGLEGPFLRKVRDDETLLNYREGHYSIYYKDPFFIDEIVETGNGTIKRAVANLGSVKEANLAYDRLVKTAKEGVTYSKPRRGKEENILTDRWAIQSYGHTPQKLRGSKLEGVIGDIDATQSNILSPIESLARSIKTVSKKTSFRGVLDSYKSQMLESYGKVFPVHPQTKQVMIPEDIRQIRSDEVGLESLVASAKADFNYYQFLQSGYVNSIDDTYKVGMQTLSQLTERYGVVSNALKTASSAKPTGILKNSAHVAYIALNPFRQWIVQSHQAVRLMSVFPKYMASGDGAADAITLITSQRGIAPTKAYLKLSGKTEAQARAMIKAYEDSGLNVAQSSNSMVKEDLIHLTDTTFISKTRAALAKPINVAQELGFGVGESINMAMAWGAHYDRALKSGLPMTRRVLDQIAADARHYTWNMSEVSNMAYQENMLNVVMQYQQVPQKAALQYFNRTLSGKDKAKLAMSDMIMFGLPAGVVSYVVGDLFDGSPETQHIIKRGLEESLINYVLDSDINLKDSVSPFGNGGTAQFFINLSTEGLGKAIANSPAGRLYFGKNPRITDVARSILRVTNVTEDFDTPTTWAGISKQFAQIASGFTNAEKAYHALAAHRKYNSYGIESIGEYNGWESIALAFGLDKVQTPAYWESIIALGDHKKDTDAAVDHWYNENLKHISDEGIATKGDKLDIWLKTMGEANRAWQGNPYAMKRIKFILERDLKNSGQQSLMPKLLKALEWGDTDKVRKLAEDAYINGLGSKEEADQVIQRANDIDEMRKRDKQ